MEKLETRVQSWTNDEELKKWLILLAIKETFKCQLTKGLIQLPGAYPLQLFQYAEEEGYLQKSEIDESKEEGLPCRWTLTEKGRAQLTVVLTGGVYDLLHVGHLSTLSEAASYGNFLVVVLATPSAARENKKRAPINSMDDRMALLNALEVVDLAIPGDPIDKMATVQKVKPDVIALGNDQTMSEEYLEEAMQKMGLEGVKIVRLKSVAEGRSTTRLIETIKSLTLE